MDLLLRKMAGHGLRRPADLTLFWTTDLGTLLISEGIPTVICVSRSRLLVGLAETEGPALASGIAGLLASPLPVTIREGLGSLQGFLSVGGRVRREPIGTDDIDGSLSQGVPVILCVASRSFHDDCSATGGHFVEVVGRDGPSFRVISPGRSSYRLLTVETNRLLNACHVWGGWAVLPACPPIVK